MFFTFLYRNAKTKLELWKERRARGKKVEVLSRQFNSERDQKKRLELLLELEKAVEGWRA